MKKLVILHGMASKKPKEGTPSQDIAHWLGWLKDEAKKLGYEVKNPLIQNDWESSYYDWYNEIDKITDFIDEDTILVGTSAGASFWSRWLSGNDKTIKKLIFVAPAKFPREGALEREIEFYNFDICLSLSGNNRIKDGTTIFISNDEEKHIKASKIYKKAFDAELIELENRGHFTIKHNPLNSKIPEILELLK